MAHEHPHSRMLNRYKVSEVQMASYLDCIDNLTSWMFKKKAVRGFGIGYLSEAANGRRGNRIGIIVIRDSRKPLSKFPSNLYGYATEVLDIPFKDQAFAFGRLPVPRSDRLDPVMAGTGIRNPQIGVGRLGVLGAIVFDKNSGDPMGLSVRHAIANDVVDQPIVQPHGESGKFNRKDEIGKLAKLDYSNDAALFRLNTNKRKYSAKMLGPEGVSDSYELNEPVQARIGMHVECSALNTYTCGTVMAFMKWKEKADPKIPLSRKHRIVRKVIIEFHDVKESTVSGDSGAVWVETKSKCPIGLHRGLLGQYAQASCMVSLSKWGNFGFKKSRVAQVEQRLAGANVGFAQVDRALFAFCSYAGTSRKMVLRKFDMRQKKQVSSTELDVYPMSGVSATVWNKNRTAKTSDVRAAWRGSDDGIYLASLKSGTQLGNAKRIEDFRTRCRPALTQYKNRLVVAFTDAITANVNIAYSSNQKDWTCFEITNAKTHVGPALAEFNGKLQLCWVGANDKKLNLVDVRPFTRSNLQPNWRVVSTKQTACEPCLQSVDGKLFLAYTSLQGKLRILESKTGQLPWKIRFVDNNQVFGSPDLHFDNNDWICLRNNPFQNQS